MLDLRLSDGKKLEIQYPIRLKNSQGKTVYFEGSDGSWYKCEYNKQSEVVYYEDSTGIVRDKRPKLKEYSMEDLEVILGHPLKIKSKGV